VQAAAGERLAALYGSLGAPIVVTDPTTAELAKVAANAFLAMKISFANVVADIATGVRADGVKVIEVLSLDPRIGRGHLQAGLGFGGSCLPKDLAAMEDLARRFSSPALFSAGAEINRGQPRRVIEWLQAKSGDLDGKHVCVLGASFKSGTDDVRASPALLLAAALVQVRAHVSVFDPAVRSRPDGANGLRWSRSPRAAARNADALIIATDWPEFASLDLAMLRRQMRGDLLVDGRGMLDPDAARACGFDVLSLSLGEGR
jgi:UDPglucose 6-dehydrogenase